MKQTLTISRAVSAAILITALSACEPGPPPIAPDPSPQDVYFERLSMLCGKAYPGKLVSDQEADADMMDQPMIMHVATCDQNEIQIPFHISQADGTWNRSRTWIITRTEDGLRLKHRHRHEDGSLDTVSNYGGDTADDGSEDRQEFPVDDESIALFETAGLDQSVTNTWAVEISPPGEQEARFAYELRRPETSGGRFFRVAFDLAQPVDAPPPPWGD
ncbi:hypothetical protein [Parasphingorhabdus cellanae]|uniref:Secreted protein n=1 Tax=Parasphingorhabdus cellanae TaxID=2806553 RepID=A0ABX7T923_9SPHN|nr:hypothetical protein [Parasphingorhabdus cellanae]QTD56727.1 hypothetical protein J4G78_03875 [Parasphingorhabdus cellanae]